MNLPKIKRRLDRLASKVVLSAAERTCNRCGATTGRMNCCHIIPKEITSLRWNTNNLLCLCISCHKFGKDSCHKNPVVFTRWLESKVGKSYLDKLIAESKKEFVLDSNTVKVIESDLNAQFNSLMVFNKEKKH
jgi:hypothetical protein